MAQTTVMDPGMAPDVQTFTVADGEKVTIGIFCAAGMLPTGAYLTIRKVTPGEPNFVAKLRNTNLNSIIDGLGQYEIVRPDLTAYGKNIGAYRET